MSIIKRNGENINESGSENENRRIMANGGVMAAAVMKAMKIISIWQYHRWRNVSHLMKYQRRARRRRGIRNISESRIK
jgi:hypothetical protein